MVGWEEVGLGEDNAVADGVAGGILGGHPEGIRRKVGSQDVQIGKMMGQRNSDAARAGTDIGGLAAAGMEAQPGQGLLYQQLGLRTGDEHGRGDAEIQAKELPAAEKIGQRLAALQPFQVSFEKLDLLGRQPGLGMGHEPGARNPQPVGEQHLRIQRGGLTHRLEMGTDVC